MLSLGQGNRIRRQTIQKLFVPLCINQSRAFVLQLMAHPAGAKNHNIQVFVKAFYSAADRLSKVVAAIACWRWILYHIHT